MWNQTRTDTYQGMVAETVTMPGFNQEVIQAYFSKPLTPGPHPGVILIPHMPGWDELNREVARRLTDHGFMVLCPNIYQRFGHGLPAEIAIKARKAGLVPDESVMGDCRGALDYLLAQPESNGRVGVIGMCSGGRHAFMAACQVPELSAAVELWGGHVVMDKLSSSQPVAPIDLTPALSCPLLGIFGNDDDAPTPGEVDQHEAELRRQGKDYTFHRYDGAEHAIWNYTRDSYRPGAAMDSWDKVLAFFEHHLKR